MNAEARNQVRGIQGSFKSLLSPTFARLFVVDKEWNLITYLPEKETEQEWPKSTTMTARPSLVNCRLHKWTNWKRKCSVFWICHESGVAITPAYLTKGMESMALRARADAYATQTIMHTSRVLLQQTIMHASRFALEQTVMHTPRKESLGDKTTTYSSCVNQSYQQTGLLRILHSQMLTALERVTQLLSTTVK